MIALLLSGVMNSLKVLGLKKALPDSSWLSSVRTASIALTCGSSCGICHLPLWLVITKPKAGCSTPAMYRRIDEMGESLRQRFTTQEAAEALEKGDLAGLCGSLYNVFEEVTALPELSEIRQELRQSGALAAMMTGSGSAVFGIFPEEDAAKVAAEKMAESRWAICCRGSWRECGRNALGHRCM